MTSSLTIGQLGKHVGLPAKTIRFYEDIGLIASAKRAKNGYRLYSQSSKEELKLIKDARDLGLPITQIKKLMQGCGKDCEHSKRQILTDIASYLTVVDEKVTQMQLLKVRLIALKHQVNFCNPGSDTYRCNILKQLSDLSKGGE